MKELLEYILDSLFANPAITVSEEEDGEFITLIINAPQDEIGKIIGKKGKVINAIKQIIKIQAIKENKRVEIQVSETDS